MDSWGFRGRTSQGALFLLIPNSLSANAGIFNLSGRAGRNCVSTKTGERFLASQTVKCEERRGVESYRLDDGPWPHGWKFYRLLKRTGLRNKSGSDWSGPQRQSTGCRS